MPDPGQASSQFLAGEQLVAAQLDVDNDLIPYFKHYVDSHGNDQYLACTVSPTDLYNAMIA